MPCSVRNVSRVDGRLRVKMHQTWEISYPQCTHDIALFYCITSMFVWQEFQDRYVLGAWIFALQPLMLKLLTENGVPAIRSLTWPQRSRVDLRPSTLLPFTVFHDARHARFFSEAITQLGAKWRGNRSNALWLRRMQKTSLFDEGKWGRKLFEWERHLYKHAI